MQKKYQKHKLELQLKLKKEQQPGQMRFQEPESSTKVRCWLKIESNIVIL